MGSKEHCAGWKKLQQYCRLILVVYMKNVPKWQEELVSASNEARVTWGELWFDKIIVAAPGSTAVCIAQAPAGRMG